jgi:hypothetical protein
MMAHGSTMGCVASYEKTLFLTRELQVMDRFFKLITMRSKAGGGNVSTICFSTHLIPKLQRGATSQDKNAEKSWLHKVKNIFTDSQLYHQACQLGESFCGRHGFLPIASIWKPLDARDVFVQCIYYCRCIDRIL